MFDKHAEQQDTADRHQNLPDQGKAVKLRVREYLPERYLRYGNAQHQHGQKCGGASCVGERRGNNDRNREVAQIEQNSQGGGNGSGIDEHMQFACFCDTHVRIRSFLIGCFLQDCDAEGVDQEIVKQIINGHKDQGTGSQNSGGQRNTDKSHVAEDGEHPIGIVGFFRDAQKPWGQKTDSDQNGIDHSITAQGGAKLGQGYLRSLIESGADQKRRIRDVDNEPGELFGGRLRQHFFAIEDHTGSDQKEDDHHLFQYDQAAHNISRFLIFIIHITTALKYWQKNCEEISDVL